jgi:hypothetical protein
VRQAGPRREIACQFEKLKEEVSMRLDLRSTSILGVAMLVIAAATPADAQGRVRAGMLNCAGGGQSSFVVGSVTQMNCVFRPDSGRPENYVATIRRYGVDVGMTTENAMAWAVLAPTQRIGRGEIAGSYGGVAAGATVGVGGTANVLVGGSNNSIALQPVSLQGSRGANVVATLAGLDLVAAAPSRRRR